jgi:acyl-CoA thioesterase-1
LTDILTRLRARKIAFSVRDARAHHYGSEYAARFNAIYPDLSEILRRAALSVFPGGSRPTPNSTSRTGSIRPRRARRHRENILPTVEAFLGTISERS